MEIYSVNNLPDTIVLGKQTEHGVTEIRIDCDPWLDVWPDLSISIWAKAPGGEGSYPVDTHMEGDVLVWLVGDADTVTAGRGSMEVMGVADGKKKLSVTCYTRVMATTTDTTTEPPEAAQAWVEKVAQDAGRAEKAATAADESAEAAEKAADAAGQGMDGAKSAAKAAITARNEAQGAATAASTSAASAARSATAAGSSASSAASSSEAADKAAAAAKQSAEAAANDAKDSDANATRAEDAAEAAAQSAQHAGDALANMPDLFVIRMVSNKADRTPDEITEAYRAGKTLLLVPGMGQVCTYQGRNAAGEHQFCQFSYDYGADGAQTGIWVSHRTVAQDGTVTSLLFSPARTPNPRYLQFTGAVTASYDGSKPVIVNIPEGGGGGGDIDTPTDAEMLEALVEYDLLSAVVAENDVLADEAGNILEW